MTASIGYTYHFSSLLGFADIGSATRNSTRTSIGASNLEQSGGVDLGIYLGPEVCFSGQLEDVCRKASEAKGKPDYKVELKPKPKEVSNQVEPADAEILVDGNPIGRGTYKASFLVGKEVKIGVPKKGYEEKITSIQIALDTAPTLKLALDKVSYAGDKLQFRIQHPGYREKQVALEVKESGDNSLEVVLNGCERRFPSLPSRQTRKYS